MKIIIILTAVLFLMALQSEAKKNRKAKSKPMKGYVELTETSCLVDSGNFEHAVWQKIPCRKCAGKGFVVEIRNDTKRNSSSKILPLCPSCNGTGTKGIKKDIQR